MSVSVTRPFERRRLEEEGKRGRRGNGASPPVICNSQVGRAERCEIPGRFSGEEQARRTKRTRRCLSGLFANDVPMSRVTLTRRHLEPAAMNFSSNVFPRRSVPQSDPSERHERVSLLIADAYLHFIFLS